MPQTQAKLTGKRCQCAVCGEYFSAISNFDRHRQGDHAKSRFCVNPETVGMIIKHTSAGTFWTSKPPAGFSWERREQ